MDVDDGEASSSAGEQAIPGETRTTRSSKSLESKRLGDVMLIESDDDDRLARIPAKRNLETSQPKHNGAKSANKLQKVIGSTRKSGRTISGAHYIDLANDTDDIATEPEMSTPKSNHSSIVKKREKEIFGTEYSTEWEERHWDICEQCRESDSRPLIYCQACAVAVHQECFGRRGEVRHHVTRLSAAHYVLQCRHCVGRGGKRGGNRSYVTGKVGPLCKPFPSLLSKLPDPAGSFGNDAEQQVRLEEALSIDQERNELMKMLYDVSAVMFRCKVCMRPAMYEELNDTDEDDPEFDPGQCVDCNKHRQQKIHLVLGWREMNDDKLDTLEVVKRDLPSDFLHEYLVKFQEQPYLAVEWVTASWLHGIATSKKKHFDAKELPAIQSQTDVIPEDYNQIDLVLDVRYSKILTFEQMEFDNEEQALKAITKVDSLLAKWQQVQYDDISWTSPPRKHLMAEDELLGRRWQLFEAAYHDWVRGFYVMVDRRQAAVAAELQAVPFFKLEKKTQPVSLQGGDLMPYQLEGLNWLYYQYYLKHPAILADEMGLGKTIQIISLLSVLNNDWSVAPFLIVAPNSTISNWKRECQKWAPHLRVACFYGEKSAKEVQEEYELVHHDVTGKPLKVHAVITSYNTIETDSAFLKKYHWACLIVDEGQRLKNDESILFKLLADYKVNHRILLTGTPLQNNTKELFNLLQFLDPTKMNAAQLEKRFDIERQESLKELHAMLKPYFLRRTKVQVLKFLPQKNEVIVPVTMTSLQKELYKTILSKNAELMRLVMSRSSAGKAIQNYNNTSLGNVLQQIRKILSHPFIYSPDIEEDIEDSQQSLLNLTNACAKLLLLKVLLPALKSQGHRVLIFCQFIMMLDILEDWMNASGIEHCRIDGNTPTPERQESIDRFNAPGSSITCFLLSTRAGGVGINLATADTVIIYDADFNPHQDLQAVARAHRIGQKNKVVVFTLVTRNTAEEKILQVGRKKMVLDQLIIENMATKEENVPYQEILSFGAAALFDEEAKNELIYDVPTVDKLIENSFADIERPDEIEADAEKPNDSFGFAKVWAGDALADEEIGVDGEQATTEDLWSKILEQRAAEAKAEADRKSAEFSKGRRRTVKDYNEANSGKALDLSLRAKANDDKSSVVDLAPDEEDVRAKSDSDGYSEALITDDSSDASTISADEDDTISLLGNEGHPVNGTNGNGYTHLDERAKQCKICFKVHLGGQCQLRNIPIEVCTLCKTAHFSGSQNGRTRPCPVFSDPAAMRSILEELKKSNEPPELIDQAKAYLRGAIGAINRKAKLENGANRSEQENETRVSASGALEV